MELSCHADWNSDGVVAKFLLAEQEARDSIPNLTTTISEIGYLLLPSHNLAEISPKRRKSSEQQTRLEYNRHIQRIQKIPISRNFCIIEECVCFQRGTYRS